MPERVPPDLAERGKFPAEFPHPAVKTDLLSLAKDHMIVIGQEGVFLVQQAHAAGIDRS